MTSSSSSYQSAGGIAGKRFLSDLAAALPDSQAAASSASVPPRPVLGGAATPGAGKGDLPDSTAHSWNVDVPDFVPLKPRQQQAVAAQQPAGAAAAFAPPPQQPQWQQQMQQHQLPASDAIGHLVSQSLTALATVAATGDREGTDEQLNGCLLRLYQVAQSPSDLKHLVQTAIAAARRSSQLCESAASLLAFLAVNFVVSDQVSPHLRGIRGQLDFNPAYGSLLTVCDAENSKVRAEIASHQSISPEQSNYILVFAWLYFYLPSLHAPSQRQTTLAKATLDFLNQLANLPACPLAYKTVCSALTAVGAPLDYDALELLPPLNGGEPPRPNDELIKKLSDLYNKIRAAAAEGLVGDPMVSLEIIRLLELRASCWMSHDTISGGGFAGAPTAAGSGPAFGRTDDHRQPQSQQQQQAVMTDDMYADFERFLMESGQL